MVKQTTNKTWFLQLILCEILKCQIPLLNIVKFLRYDSLLSFSILKGQARAFTASGIAYVRLSSCVQNLEQHHLVVHHSVECVHFLQIGIIFTNISTCYEANYQRCKNKIIR